MGHRSTRRELLSRMGAVAALASVPLPSIAVDARPKRLIYVFVSGGWDITYCMDPKGHVPAIEGPEWDGPEDEREETIGSIPLALNDVRRGQVTAFFERWGPRVAVVNGIVVGTLGHPNARVRMLTGTRNRNGAADLAAIAGATHGGDLPIGTLNLSSLAIPGPLAAHTLGMGPRWQATSVMDEHTPIPPAPGATLDMPAYAPDDADRDALIRWREAELDVLRAGAGRSERSVSRISDLASSLVRSERLRGRSEAFGQPGFGLYPSILDTALLAVDVLQQGICQSVFMDTGFSWDSHTLNVVQHKLYNRTFGGLSVLVDELQRRKMLDETLVVIASEMTRMPEHNGQEGKDHWPYTSALLIGGGTVGGQVLGGTDDLLTPRPIDHETGQLDPQGSPLAFDSFQAGLMERLDIDPGRWLPGVRPWRGGLG